MYDLIAKRSHMYALAYPFIELTLGLLYLFGWQLILANWLTMVLMLISTSGVAQALLNKQNLTCACLGMVFKLPMTYVTLLEDLLMLCMAAISLFKSL